MQNKDLSLVTSKRLKKLRNEMGISHSKLAAALVEKYNIRISSDVLKNYEVTDEFHTKFNAVKGMNIEYLFCLAEFYGVSTDYLLGKSDIKSPNIKKIEMHKKIGLNDEAINVLEKVNKTQKDTLYLLNDFIASKDIFFIIYLIQLLVNLHRHSDYSEEFEIFYLQKELTKLITRKANNFIKSKKTEEERQHDIVERAKEYLKNYGLIMKEDQNNGKHNEKG
jgi:hypothetical protein